MLNIQTSTPDGADLWEIVLARTEEVRAEPVAEMEARPLRVDHVFEPLIEMIETADGLRISVEIPGVRGIDVEVVVEGDRVTISGRREAPRGLGGERVRVREISYGSFARSVRIPPRVDAGGLTAVLDDGLLTLQLPRRR